MLRDAQSTRRHIGYCDIAGEGNTIADCTDNGITDANLADALQMMPGSVEVLFLSGNVGITNIGGAIFKNNLKKPENLKALLANDLDISSLPSDTLEGLSGLQIFDVDNNPGITGQLPEDLLEHTPLLKEFSIFQSALEDSSDGAYDAYPENLLQPTPNLDRLVVYGYPNVLVPGDTPLWDIIGITIGVTGFAPNFFKGLEKLEFLSAVFNNIKQESMDGNDFSDLKSVLFFDWFGNSRVNYFNPDWFNKTSGGGLPTDTIIRLAFWDETSPPGRIAGDLTMDDDTLAGNENSIFKKYSWPALEVAYFHNQGVKNIDIDQFLELPNFASLTV